MDKTTMEQFKSAIESAEIKDYCYVTDTPSYFYNNKENSIIIEDMGNEIAYCFRDNSPYGSGNYFEKSDLVGFGAKFEDIHEVRVGATYQQMVNFIEAIGLDITDEQKELLLKVCSRKFKSPINPPTGDYTFKELTEEEIAQLSEEEKEAYNKAYEAWKRKKYGLQRGLISVDNFKL